MAEILDKVWVYFVFNRVCCSIRNLYIFFLFGVSVLKLAAVKLTSERVNSTGSRSSFGSSRFRSRYY